jgi:membrane protein implicated in regulation of membrane protease activity
LRSLARSRYFAPLPIAPIIGLVQAILANLSWAAKSSGWWVQESTFPILAVLLLFTPTAAARSNPSQPDLKALFAVVGRMHNIDPALLEAIAEVESRGDSQSVSPKGALGLMQLMPVTANAFSVLDPLNPVANVMGAANFLDYLRNRLANNLNLQSLPALLAAYNAGPGAVEKYGGIPPYAETHNYVRRVIERYANGLSAQSAVAPVLILGPKPYVIQLGSGSNAMQPEPVLISVDGEDSVVNPLAKIRRIRGHFVAAIGTGSTPWIRHSPLPTTPTCPGTQCIKVDPDQLIDSQYSH